MVNKGAVINANMYTTPTGEYVLCPHCDNFVECRYAQEHIKEFHIDHQPSNCYEKDRSEEAKQTIKLQNGLVLKDINELINNKEQEDRVVARTARNIIMKRVKD